MKHFFLSLLSLFILGLAGVAILSGWAINQYLSPGPLNEDKLVLIERGSGISNIAEQLDEEGVISHAVLFKVGARFGESLKAGEYMFPAHVSIAESIRILEEGDVFDRKITLVEGLTSYQIIRRLREREDLSGDIKTIPAEGSLLPDTYQFTSLETREDIIVRMQNAMTQAIDELWPEREEGLPIKTKKEAIILASIVEKETAVPSERARVAGVFINRLRRGIALQTDPTVIYAITKGDIKEDGKGPLGRRLLSKDLKINSPYNTYVNSGLPPGPIANPGIESIRAVLHPEEHNYIFFVADGTGGHAFAETLKEHNRNVAAWRKIRRKQ